MKNNETQSHIAQKSHNPYKDKVGAYPELLAETLSAEEVHSGFLQRVCEKKEVWLELGSGSGGFLLALAKERPKSLVLGVELRYKRIVRTAEKAKKKGQENLWLLRMPAEKLVALLPDSSLDGVFLHFPDPWPKLRHQKKRMVQKGFLDTLSRKIKFGGGFFMKTDHAGYFLHSLACFRESPQFSPVFCSNHVSPSIAQGWPLSFPRNFSPEITLSCPSEFEAMFRLQKKPVYCLWAKVEA